MSHPLSLLWSRSCVRSTFGSNGAFRENGSCTALLKRQSDEQPAGLRPCGTASWRRTVSPIALVCCLELLRPRIADAVANPRARAGGVLDGDLLRLPGRLEVELDELWACPTLTARSSTVRRLLRSRSGPTARRRRNKSDEASQRESHSLKNARSKRSSCSRGRTASRGPGGSQKPAEGCGLGTRLMLPSPDLESRQGRAMDPECLSELVERLQTDPEAANLVGVFARPGQQRPRHVDDVIDLDGLAVVGDEKLATAARVSVARSGCSAPLGRPRSEQPPEAPASPAVDLLGETSRRSR